ncbi:unnamed protein product [Closterium sp. Yama58-4]|nr:unnamed protein product [Closterium sp. Yama58-4]
MEPLPAIGFPFFADSLHASKRLRSLSSSPISVPPATLLDTTLSLSSNPVASPPPCPPCNGAILEQCLPRSPCDDNTNVALPFLSMLRGFKPQAQSPPQIPRVLSSSPLRRTNPTLPAVPAAIPAASPAAIPARCPLPPVEALRRAVKRSHAAARLDEEVTSQLRTTFPSDCPLQVPSNALEVGAAASGLPAVLPCDADVAERLVKYDRLTSSLRGSLPAANLAQWDAAVGKLRDRVAMKEEFGNDVNGFLLFLHAQLGAQQPSARKALQLFAAFKQAQRQKQNSGAALASEAPLPAAAAAVSRRVSAQAPETDDDTASVCSNDPECAEPRDGEAEASQAESSFLRRDSSASSSVPSASSALGIDVSCPAAVKKMLFELQSAVVQLERNTSMDSRIKAESLAVLRTAQSHLLSRLAAVVRSV